MYGENIKSGELFVHDISVANTFNLLFYKFYILDSSLCAFAI